MDKAMEYIDKLAAKLGVAAEHVYGVLVKQAFANGVTDSIIGFVFLMIAVIAGVIITKVTVKSYEKSHCSWDYEWFPVVLAVCFFSGYSGRIRYLCDHRRNQSANQPGILRDQRNPRHDRREVIGGRA